MKKIILVLGLFLSQFSYGVDSERAQLDVLIVGAGPAGLTMAKALQNNGINPDIIEKKDEVRFGGAGIVMPANGSWALSKLGIDISSFALHIPKMTFTDDQGEVLIEHDIQGIHPEGAQFYSLSRDELMQLITSSLNTETSIQTSVQIANLTEEADGVNVEFTNGLTKHYDLVIGCDGIHSDLRMKTHPHEVSEFLGLLVWRATIENSIGIGNPTYMLGSDRLVLLYPMPNNRLYVYGHLTQTEKFFPKENFSTLFSSFGGLVPDVIRQIDQLNATSNPVNFLLHHMEKSHSVRFKLEGFNRILLVGDAAHAFGPSLQNGAAQAFEDAYVFQELLSSSLSREDVPSLLDAFEKRRSARVQQVFALSNATIKIFSDPIQIQVRNEAIRKYGAPNVHGFKLIMQQNP